MRTRFLRLWGMLLGLLPALCFAQGLPTTLNANGVSVSAPAAATDGNGITVSTSGSTATFQLEYADGTHPGIVSTGTQTFAGAKTFSSMVTGLGFVATQSSNTAISLPAGSYLEGAGAAIGAAPVHFLGYSSGGVEWIISDTLVPNAGGSFNLGSASLAWLSVFTNNLDIGGPLNIGTASQTGLTIGRSGQTTNVQGTVQINGSAIIQSSDAYINYYDPVTLTTNLSDFFVTGPTTNAQTLRQITFTVAIAGTGSGTETIKLCDTAGCGSGTIYGTLSVACNGTVGTVTTGTVNTSAIAASKTLHSAVTSACTTADIAGNISAHVTTP